LIFQASCAILVSEQESLTLLERIVTILTRRSAMRLLAGVPALVLGPKIAHSLVGSPPPQESRINQIIVVCKTHFDIGYSDRVANVLTFYRTTMIDRALDLIDKSTELPPEEQFIWTCPGWVFDRVVEDWPGQTAERRQRLDRAVKSGRLVAHALPFSVESELMWPEEFARGYAFADDSGRRYGIPRRRGAKTSDLPSQSRALATGLAHGGIRFMHIGCNWPSGYVHGLPPLFWWEGPDGSRVLTMYSTIYGTCTALWPWGGEGDPYIGHNLLLPTDWPYKTWPAIIVTSDNSGPPTLQAVRSLFAEALEKLPDVKVRMGTLDDIADAILAEKPELAVVRAETPDTWIHGCMSDPGGMRLARNVHPLIPAVEVLHTQLRQWGVQDEAHDAEVAKAFEQSLLYSEHTWGLGQSVDVYGQAFKEIPPGKFQKLEASWEDKTNYIRNAAEITSSMLETGLSALTQAVDVEGSRVVVYNPLPWPRSGIVEIDGTAFLAKDVPALGYRAYPPPPNIAPQPLSGDTLENEFIRVRLDPVRGVIASLVEKRTGREWVDESAEVGLGQYLNERFESSQTEDYCRAYQQGRWGDHLHPGMYKPGLPPGVRYRRASGSHGSLSIVKHGQTLTGVLEMSADLNNHLPATALRATLREGVVFLDVEVTIKDKAKDNWPEADWLCLPFRLNSPQFCVARTLGVMDPARDIMPGSNRHLYAVGAGLTITGSDGASVSLCPIDHPLVSLDTPGIWKFSLDFAPKKPVVFLNLYNNQWNTNYRYWYSGTWSSRVRIWFGDKLSVPALETMLPLVASAGSGARGILPSSQSGLSVSRPGVVVTALKQKPESKVTTLRLWELAGESGKVTVRLPSGSLARVAKPVDLRGESIGPPIAVEGGCFEFFLNGFAPASFELE
jgi:alpha-mannosidase